MIEAAHIDWDRTDLLVPYFDIRTEIDRDAWGPEIWMAYSHKLGPAVATVTAPTRDEAIYELVDWLQGYCERRYGAMWPECT